MSNMLFRWRSSNYFQPKLPKECIMQPQDEAKKHGRSIRAEILLLISTYSQTKESEFTGGSTFRFVFGVFASSWFGGFF